MLKLFNPVVRTSYVKVRDISMRDISQMYAIFEKYYEHSPFEKFLSDLNKKDGAFLVRRTEDEKVVGFSTLAVYNMEVDGRRIKGVFSGDTIVEKEYWGLRALTTAFVIRVLKEALKNPFTPQYWFLISKGYKTFLVLSKNFPEYYPNPQGKYPHLRRIVEAYSEQLFPGTLDRQAMVLDFGFDYNHLKDNVTPITPEMRRREPDIAFFERCNPDWERGTELPCVGRADLVTFCRVLGPQIWKAVFKPSRSGSRPRPRAQGASAPDTVAPTMGKRSIRGWLMARLGSPF